MSDRKTPPPAAVIEPIEVAVPRYVLYSDVHGIYLGIVNGRPLWSYDGEAASVLHAPAHTEDEWAKITATDGWPRDARKVRCFPDAGTSLCSQTAIGNANLPRWIHP